MHTTAAMDVPEEILFSTQLTAERLVERAKLEAALALYREGRLSSGLAAKWLGESRVSFLHRAFAAGIPLLDDSLDDFDRERGLL
jgi:predicted HTH domain antitoxin